MARVQLRPRFGLGIASGVPTNTYVKVRVRVRVENRAK